MNRKGKKLYLPKNHTNARDQEKNGSYMNTRRKKRGEKKRKLILQLRKNVWKERKKMRYILKIIETIHRQQEKRTTLQIQEERKNRTYELRN